MNSLRFTFLTDQEGKTLTKSYSGYNADVTDDTCRAAAKTLANAHIFVSDAGTIQSVKKIQKITTEVTEIPVDA